MKATIAERRSFNLERVEHLVTIYETVAGSGSGRRPPKLEDILRAATVLLHASLEDFLRSIEEWRLPLAGAEFLSEVPLIGWKPDSKYNLSALAKHRGKPVDQVIKESVAGFLGRKTYNNPGDVKAALAAIGLNQPALAPAAEALAPLMDRRHHIVHRADRNEQTGTGQNRTKSLSRTQVIDWTNDVRLFSDAVLAELP